MNSCGNGVKKLEFQLNERLKTAIDEAKVKVHDTCSSLSVCAAQYDRYGSKFIKECGLRADPLMQLAFQVELSPMIHVLTIIIYIYVYLE